MTVSGNVFVVDDEPIILNVLLRAMRGRGLNAEGFLDGASFLARLGADTTGCLIVDLDLPGMNGLDLLRAVRARGAQVRSLVLSGMASVQTTVAAMQAGALDVLEKPLPMEELGRRVESVLDRVRRESETVGDFARAWHQLSDGDREIAGMILDGLGDKAIAARRGVSRQAVSARRRALFSRVGVGTAVEFAQAHHSAREAGHVAD